MDPQTRESHHTPAYITCQTQSMACNVGARSLGNGYVSSFHGLGMRLIQADAAL